MPHIILINSSKPREPEYMIHVSRVPCIGETIAWKNNYNRHFYVEQVAHIIGDSETGAKARVTATEIEAPA